MQSRHKMTPFHSFGIALNIFLFLATWLGNSLVCISILRIRTLRTVSNVVIFSLALADLLMTVVFMFRIIALSIQEQFPVACHAISEFAFTLVCVIILHLTCISVDRFIAIKFPLRYKTVLTRRRMKTAVVAIWLFSITGTVIFPHSLPTTEYEDFVDYYDTFHLCMTHPHDHQFQNTSKVFAALLVIVYFIIPFLVTFSCYIYVIKASRDQQLKLKRDAHLEKETVRRIEIKVAITYGIVVGAFMLCFLPLLVGTLYQQFENERREDMAQTMQVLSTVASVSACLNPGVYTWRSQKFRKAFKKIITRTQ